MDRIREGRVTLELELAKGDVSKEMEIFYNPLMRSNRNISIAVLAASNLDSFKIALPLAGSGIRALRFAKELDKKKISFLFVNDRKEEFGNYFQQQAAANTLSCTQFTISMQDANSFLTTCPELHEKPDGFCGYFNYIDLDPFGSPNPFLAAAVSRIERAGILAITATDTGALSGTYPKVTRRKYWARQRKTPMMHELGLRILIRKVQLQAVQFGKVLTPILSYHKDHYMRVYFKSSNSKQAADALLDLHKFMLYCFSCGAQQVSSQNAAMCNCGAQQDGLGPLWSGALHDSDLLTKMLAQNLFEEEKAFLQLLHQESTDPHIVGFYDLHYLDHKYQLPGVRLETVLEKLGALRTHFSPTGFRSSLSIQEIVKKIKE